jgi:hypothetical protein
MVDADESVTPELKDEIAKFVERDEEGFTMGRMRRKDRFMGRWLNRSSGYPTWFGRFVRPGRVRVQREINEEYLTDGNVIPFKEHLVHYPFNKGLGYWVERHNKYSSMEAQTLEIEKSGPLQWAGLWSRDHVVRRKHLKQLAYRLPGRPLLVFCYLYFLRLGLLDGGPGLTFCALRSFYEYMINVKRRELSRRRQTLPV